MNNMLCNVVSLAMAYLQVQPLPVCCGSDKDGDSVTWSIGLIMFLGREFLLSVIQVFMV